MTDSAYTIRNYRPPDFEKYTRLHIEAEKPEPAGQRPSPQTLSEKLRRPNYSPEKNLFIVETAGNIVGCLDITLELWLGRVILNCLIHPGHRRRGLATKLLGHALSRAKELSARVAHVSILQDNAAAESALTKLGFKFIRRFRQMRLDITQLQEEEINQAAQQCRHLQGGEEDKLTEIQNRAFTGTWGYNPNTVEEITYQLNLSHSSPEDVLLAEDGDRFFGYCWTGITSETTESEIEGRIFMLGVDPDYRGQGIGKRVLLAGLSHLRSKGFSVAELTVASQNKEAYALYQSIGFKVKHSILWYEKAVG